MQLSFSHTKVTANSSGRLMEKMSPQTITTRSQKICNLTVLPRNENQSAVIQSIAAFIVADICPFQKACCFQWPCIMGKGSMEARPCLHVGQLTEKVPRHVFIYLSFKRQSCLLRSFFHSHSRRFTIKCEMTLDRACVAVSEDTLCPPHPAHDHPKVAWNLSGCIRVKLLPVCPLGSQAAWGQESHWGWEVEERIA